MKGVICLAIYHCSVKVLGRNEGKSAIAAAAYRAGEKLTSIYDGITRDYTKKGWVEDKFIMLPDHAPQEYMERSQLWNAVETAEKTSNAQLAREVEVSLPVEMTREEQLEVVREFVQKNFVSQGMCADIAIHNPPVKNDRNQAIDADGNPTKDESKMQFKNPHAHILLTVRPISKDGKWEEKSKVEYLCMKDGEEKGFTAEEFQKAKFEGWEKQFKFIDGKKKVWLPGSIGNEKELKRVNRTPKTSKFGRKNPTVEYWNSDERVPEWRKSWEDCVNKKFEELEKDIHIDSRSYEAQGIDRLPTIHMGPAAINMERKADREVREGASENDVIRSDIGDINREIKKYNTWLILAKSMLESKISKLKSVIESVAPVVAKKVNEVEEFIDKLKENDELFRLPSDSKYKDHFSTETLREMRDPDYIRKYVRYYKIDSFGSVTVAYKKAEKEMKVYQSTRLTNKQKVERLKDYAETYQMIQKVKAVYDESQKKFPVSRMVYDNLHKEELAEYHRLVEKLNGMLDGAPITPKKWNKEIKTLQAEIAELDKKIEAKYRELVCEEAIEETVKYGGKARSLKHNLEAKKDIATQRDDDDNSPGNSNPSHDGMSIPVREDPEERKKNKPSWDAL